MGLLAPIYHLWDTLCYIHDHGWAEYRKARERYDNHMRLQNYGDAKFNKRNYIKMLNQQRKAK